MQSQALVINPKDNVATALVSLSAGQTIKYFLGKEIKELTLLDNIPRGHKIALQDISEGQEIIKYGESIGSSVIVIKKGQHVHVHNMQSQRGRGDWQNI
ncbi:MAG TPA: UxaA family hydrolase [Peptococcaceae bacterium]|nr:UxaA family hydrolase [Peptococcaceae bacterium]